MFEKKYPEGIFRVSPQKQEGAFNVQQTHSIEISDCERLNQPADGLFDQTRKKQLVIKTADCLPILFLSPKANALIHAGHAGLQKGIIEELYKKHQDFTQIFVGPCIHKCCFKVTPEFKDRFPNSPHFQNSPLAFDLVAHAKDQCHQFFPQAKFDSSSICTCCNEQFQSYRRNKTPLRNWNHFLPF